VATSAPRILVYGPPRAPFNAKVLLALGVKRLDCKVVELSGSAEFRKVNPETGMVPVMDYDDRRIHDSARILDWIDEQHPEPPLVARDPRVARSQRGLEAWIGETFYFYWLRWLRVQLAAEVAGADAGASEGPPGELARMGVLDRVRAAVSDGSFPAGLSGTGFSPEFSRRLDDLVGFLGERPYLYAERVSRADLTAVAFLRTLEWGWVPGGPDLLRARPSLGALMQRVARDAGC
jgi:glutathione S-transferase